MTEISLVRYKTKEGTRPALVKYGRKWHRVVTFGTPVSVTRVRADEARYMVADIQHRGKPYDLKRALRLYRAAGRKGGITQGAKDIIAQAAAQAL